METAKDVPNDSGMSNGYDSVFFEGYCQQVTDWFSTIIIAYCESLSNSAL